MVEQAERQVVFWDCDDGAEILYHDTKDEVLEAYLDSVDRDKWERVITVYGYARMIVPEPDDSDAASVAEETLDCRWEDFIGEDGSDVTDRMKEAALTFLKVLHEEFVPWACEVVTSEEVDVAAWIKEHRPDWLEQQKGEKIAD